MSCSYGNLPRGKFSSQKDTWSPKSNLSMAQWDPYPELQDPKNCYGTNVETYCCAMPLYNVQPDLVNAQYAPLQKSVVVAGGLTRVLPAKEGFVQYGCCPARQTYAPLKQTWDTQKPYQL